MQVLFFASKTSLMALAQQLCPWPVLQLNINTRTPRPSLSHYVMLLLLSYKQKSYLCLSYKRPQPQQPQKC